MRGKGYGDHDEMRSKGRAGEAHQRSTVPMSAWDALMGDGRVIVAPDVSTT